MQEFILILHDPVDSPFFKLSPEEMQSVIARYKKWSAEMAAKGKLRAGKKLDDTTKRSLVKGDGGVVTDGPFPETKEIIGGLFHIEAEDLEEAVAISSTCPHLDFGRIELRRVEVV